jgi:Na+/proline symporter
MAEILLLLLFVGSVLITYRSARSKPLPPVAPLEIGDSRDTTYTAWAGHASTVFSLNALFGAYLVMLVAIGPSALLGVATGGTSALLIIYRSCKRENGSSFEQFLRSRSLTQDNGSGKIFWSLIIITQLCYATAEIVILKNIVQYSLAMAPQHALAFAMFAALVGYMYCALGGWGGVFLTDTFQLVFSITMCLIFLAFAVAALIEDGALSLTASEAPDLWHASHLQYPLLRRIFEFAVGVTMGAGFLLASPDAWKRVHLAEQTGGTREFAKLAAAGFLPFILLLPAVLVVPKPDLSDPEIFHFMPFLHQHPGLLLALVLGITASFLSSFDSSLLAATHIALIKRRRASAPPYTLSDFHYVVGSAFLAVIFFSIVILTVVGNPYAIGLSLMGLYGLVAGLTLGTNFLSKHISPHLLSIFCYVSVAIWAIILASRPELYSSVSPNLLDLIPAAGLLFILAALFAGAVASPKNHREREGKHV